MNNFNFLRSGLLRVILPELFLFLFMDNYIFFAVVSRASTFSHLLTARPFDARPTAVTATDAICDWVNSASLKVAISICKFCIAVVVLGLGMLLRTQL